MSAQAALPQLRREGGGGSRERRSPTTGTVGQEGAVPWRSGQEVGMGTPKESPQCPPGQPTLEGRWSTQLTQDAPVLGSWPGSATG